MKREVSKISIIIVLLLMTSTVLADKFAIFVDPDCPRAQFAAGEIKTALKAQNHSFTQSGLTEFSNSSSDLNIVLATTSDKIALDEKPAKDLKAEGFSIRTAKSGKKPRTR